MNEYIENTAEHHRGSNHPDGQLRVEYVVPSVEEYRALRKEAGLTQITEAAAAKGLPNSLFGLTLRIGQELIGMGRVSGDGGVFFLVTDIAVKPSHQGKGYGRKLMEEIMAYLKREVPAGSFATLIADKPADRLYAQFGFQLTSPGSEGMYWRQPGGV
ncbi:GNAT family N-acetyltransferase [Paenibacillus sp. 23TSA30-6]|uniref:GNAT family N-acetyltransferase n=1 Tax=Paenibacillus sp. 23TSA30-6 TaxID=2546104 RepID=UPI00178899FD|nr:GNAT family N-acetyltransferase [Paenibacillus sp. 23TSA30-6]MBE0338432.1 N-acetyltransferase [Paenibacillus sp. 23TSA30-6]